MLTYNRCNNYAARHGKEQNLAGSKLNFKNGRKVSTRGQEGCAETRQKGH